MSDETNGPHGPDCTCPPLPEGAGEWQPKAVMEAVEAAMDSVFAEGDDDARSQQLSDALNHYIGHIRENATEATEVGSELLYLAMALGRVIIRVSPKGTFGEGDGNTQAVIVDARTQMVIDDPDVEMTDASDAGMLAVWRVLSALADDDSERAISILKALPDPPSILYAAFHMLDLVGRAVIEHSYRDGNLTPAGQARLEQIHAKEQAEEEANAPIVHADPESGREFVKLAGEELDDADKARLKARSKGPAVYCMTITGPGTDYEAACRGAHQEMLVAHLHEESMTLCDHLHWEQITLEDMPGSTRIYAEREMRRRTRMLGQESVLLLSWRHTVDCEGKDVAPTPAAPAE